MKLIRLLKTILVVGLALFPVVSFAQLSDHDDPTSDAIPFSTFDSTLGTNNVFSADTTWGNAVADFATDRIYLSSSSGIQEYSMSQQMALAGYTVSSLSSIEALVPRAVFTTLETGGPDFGPCSMAPCESHYDIAEGKYVWTLPNDYDTDSWSSLATDTRDALVGDARDFEAARQERCDDYNDSLLTSSLEAPATGSACALSETVVGGFVCVGGIAKQLWDAAKRYRATSDCNTSYPGPGKWKGSRLPVNYGK